MGSKSKFLVDGTEIRDTTASAKTLSVQKGFPPFGCCHDKPSSSASTTRFLPDYILSIDKCNMTNRRALIIVDMSVEQMSTVTHNANEVVSNCRELALNANRFFDLVVDSKLWLKTPEESSLSWVFPETATTMFVADSEGARLVPELRSIPGVVFVPKNNFSCFAKSDLLQVLRDAGIQHVYICGINTDYCVFATTMASFENQFRTFVVADAVTSVRGKEAHEEGLRNLERHFSSNALVSTKDIVSK